MDGSQMRKDEGRKGREGGLVSIHLLLNGALSSLE